MELVHLLILLIVFVIVAGVCWYILNLVLAAFPSLPAPFHNIVRAIFALICLLVLLSYVFGGFGSLSTGAGILH